MHTEMELSVWQCLTSLSATVPEADIADLLMFLLQAGSKNTLSSKEREALLLNYVDLMILLEISMPPFFGAAISRRSRAGNYEH